MARRPPARRESVRASERCLEHGFLLPNLLHTLLIGAAVLLVPNVVVAADSDSDGVDDTVDN